MSQHHRQSVLPIVITRPDIATAMLSAPLSMTFDASTHPNPGDRAAAWRDAFSITVDVQFAESEVENFAASVRYQPLGSVLMVERRYTSHTVIRNRKTIARTGSEHLIFHYFLKGGIAGLVGGRNIDVMAGDCFIYDMRGTLCIHMLAGHFIGLIIPRRIFEEAAGRSATVHGLILRAGSAPAGFLGATITSLADHAPCLGANPRHRFGAALTELIAASIEDVDDALAATPHASRSASNRASARPAATPTRLRRHIDRHAADPAFNPDALASAFGLSRATLYRAFGSEGGVAEAIRRRRAALALSALNAVKSLPASLDLVARASGFHDAAALRRGLRAVYGASPATLRRHAILSNSETGPSSLAIGALFDGLPS